MDNPRDYTDDAEEFFNQCFAEEAVEIPDGLFDYTSSMLQKCLQRDGIGKIRKHIQGKEDCFSLSVRKRIIRKFLTQDEEVIDTLIKVGSTMPQKIVVGYTEEQLKIGKLFYSSK
jgi:hypothetical protein